MTFVNINDVPLGILKLWLVQWRYLLNNLHFVDYVEADLSSSNDQLYNLL